MELYEQDTVPQRTWNDVFSDTAVAQSDNVFAQDVGSGTTSGGRLIGTILENAYFRSSVSGARVEIFPNPDTGIVCYDAAGGEVFKTILAGTNVGDVIMGSYAGGKYAMWDSSASKFYIVGPTLTGLGVGSELAIQGWQFSATFSATDYRVVAWTAGTIKLMDGTTYSIDAGNTGNMAALTYIYLDIATSATVIQTTTTATTAVGSGKILIAVAKNNTDTAKDATFQVFGGSGGVGVFITADNIAADTITANEILANTITAAELSTALLYAGTITLDVNGNIKGGQTTYNTGLGFFLGYFSGGYVFSIGDGGVSNYLTWDGTNLRVNNTNLKNQSLFGDGRDGNVTISANTTQTSDMYYDNLTINAGFYLNTGGYRTFIKGRLTIAATGLFGRWGNAGGDGEDGAGEGLPAAIGGPGGVALSTGTIYGGLAGQKGGNGGYLGGGYSHKGYDGVNGTAQTESYASDGVGGGAGGNGGQGGGAGSIGGTTTQTTQPIRNAVFASIMREFSTANTVKYITSSAGSGSGGGGDFDPYGYGDGGAGGGSGSSGGIAMIAAHEIVNAGTISCAGGDGGDGGDSSNYGCGGGGGGGGSGGILCLIYNSLTNTGTITVAGGLKGLKGIAHGGRQNHDGVDGTDGIIGNLIQLEV